MKTKLTLLALLLLTGCASYQSCPTYAVTYKNVSRGTYGVQDTNEMFCPKDSFKVIPSMDIILIVDVKLN